MCVAFAGCVGVGAGGGPWLAWQARGNVIVGATRDLLATMAGFFARAEAEFGAFRGDHAATGTERQGVGRGEGTDDASASEAGGAHG
jgi:hypothetical protein